MTIFRRSPIRVPLVCFLFLSVIPNSSGSDLIVPDLAQVKTDAPEAGVNEFISGPFLEGVAAGNILYAVTTPAASFVPIELTERDVDPARPVTVLIPQQSDEFRRIGPSGALPPMPLETAHADAGIDAIIQAGLDRLRSFPNSGDIPFRIGGDAVITGLKGIFVGNGMVYPLMKHEHFIRMKSVSFGGFNGHVIESISATRVHDANFFGNGPILNNPGGTLCVFEAVHFQRLAPPLILSSNALYVPTVLEVFPVTDEPECRTDGFVINADLTAQIMSRVGEDHPVYADLVNFSFIRSCNPYDPISFPVLGRAPDPGIGFFDLARDRAWGFPDGGDLPRELDIGAGFIDFTNPWTELAVGNSSRVAPYVILNRTSGGSAVLWLGEDQPEAGTKLDATLSRGVSSPDLDPYFPPLAPVPDRVLGLSGSPFDPGTARVAQTADRFVLVSWNELGIERWGSFKYAIFGKVVSPCSGMLGDHVEIKAKHIRDGIGIYFELDDLIYPFSLADKKNSDVTIPVRADGSFSLVGVLAGTYELTFFFDGKPIGAPVRVNVTDYKSAVFELPALLGRENDQAYFSPVREVIINLSNGNLMVVSNDIELANIGPALGFTRVYNNLDVAREMNATSPVAAIPLPLGHGWTHTYNWMITKVDPMLWDDGRRKCVKDPLVILIDEDGTRHTFTLLPEAEKTEVEGRPVLEFRQGEGAGADPMRLLMTNEKRFELTLKNGTTYTFDIVQGRDTIAHLTRIEDPNKNALILDYDPKARLVQVESSSTGRKLLFEYAPGTELISKITDPQGRGFLYTYSFDPTRPSETAKLMRAESPADSPVEYVYSSAPSLVRMTKGCAVTEFLADPCRRVVAVIPPIGKTSFAYEPSNDLNITKTSIIDAAGVITAVTFDPWTRYDSAGQPVGGGRLRDVTDAEGKVTRFGWDKNGNIVQRIKANGLVITTDYDQLKNMMRRQTNSGAAPVTWTYPTNLPDFDPRRSRPTAVGGRALAPEVFLYDAAGNSVKTEQGDIVTTIKRNPDGTEAKITDPDVGPTESAYDRGNIIRLTTLTATTTFEYGAKESQGLPDRRAGPDGTKVLEYDDAGRLISARNIGVELCKDRFSDLQTSTAYDGSGNATRTASPCQTVSMEYSCANQLTKRSRFVTGLGTLEDVYFYDDRGLKTRDRLADGLEISYEHDLLRRLKSITRGTVSPRKETFEFDAAGNVSRQSNGVEEKRLEYDLENRIKREVRVLPGLSNLVTNNIYNSFGLVTEERTTGSAMSDPALVRTSSYDNLNRISEILTECAPHRFRRTFTYEPLTGRLLREDDGDYSKVYAYDRAGRVVEEREKNAASGLEQVIRKEYDANDNVTTLNAVGCHPPIERRFNQLGWLLEEKRGRLAKTFCQDHCGRIVDEGDNMGSRTTRVFNEEGRIASETRNGQTTRFSYDRAGRLLRRIDPAGAVHEWVRNEHGEPVKEKHPGVALTAGGPLRELVIDRTYDNLGNILSQTRNGADLEAFRWSGPYLMGKTDRLRRNWTYTRDAFGHLTSVADDTGLLMKYENAGCGNRIAATDANGKTTRYKYDSRGRVIEETRPDGTVITKKYHATGKLVERVTRPPLGVVRTERWEWSGGEVLERMESPEGTTIYEHNAECLLTGIKFFDRDLDYTSDLKEQVTGIGGSSGIPGYLVRYELDTNGDVTKVTDGENRVTRIEYDAERRETKRTLPNREVVEREYNAAGWPMKQTHTNGGQKFIRTWEYDDRGRVLGYTENDARFGYVYDDNDQLIRATLPDGSAFEYTYDARGNVTRVAGRDEEILQTFDASNCLVRREIRKFKKHHDRGHGNNDDHDDEDNPGRGKGKHGANPEVDDDGEDDDEMMDGRKGKRKIFEYSCDASGRLISIRQVDKKGRLVKKNETIFTWDGLNRLIRIVKKDVTVDYSYDAEGRLIRRVEREEGRVKDDRRYVWDVTSENILAELDGSGNVLARYVPTRTQDDIILKENLVTRKTAVYGDFNRNLPTQIVRDERGNIIETLSTPEPYGAMQTPSSIDHTRYMGKFIDPVTGFAYFRNRWYDPQARRFISPDPQPFDELNPTHTANPYIAFANNPVQNTDPMGMESINIDFAAFIPGPPEWMPASIFGLGLGFDYRTDNRTFGGDRSKSRLRLFISIESREIGKVSAGSGIVKVGESGKKTSSGTIEVQTATASKLPIVQNPHCKTVFRFKAGAGYPFIPGSPDIDMKIKATFEVTGSNTVLISLEGKHNTFPNYQIFAGTQGSESEKYQWTSPDPGPNPINLNSSTDFTVSPFEISATTPSGCP